VEGIGIVAERNMAESLNVTLGMILPEREVYEEVRHAIIGPASGRNADGKSFPMMPPHAAAPAMEWQQHGMFTDLRLEFAALTADSNKPPASEGFTSAEMLVEALRVKVSAMTMLHIDEVTSDRNMEDYGLDSLVSGELRTWIRREVGMDLSLPRIITAKNLRALAKDALSLR
jgi:aryl carrier-like protein